MSSNHQFKFKNLNIEELQHEIYKILNWQQTCDLLLGNAT